MCCGSKGQCLETKYCYSNLIRPDNLIGIPLTTALIPAVNTTSNPYLSNNSKNYNPCFMYAQLDTGVTTNGIYTVSVEEKYEEPEIFV